MKRDMELVRKIALALEGKSTGFSGENPTVEGYSAEEIGYHVYLMLEAGLVRGSDVTNNDSSSPEAIATGLTWQGHEFVEAARDETLWKRAMGTVRAKGGSVTIDVLKQLLATMIKETLNLG